MGRRMVSERRRRMKAAVSNGTYLIIEICTACKVTKMNNYRVFKCECDEK